jgi:hypothetical protein
MSRKLTREGIASILFSPKATYPDSKMPRFFYDEGEAQDKNADLPPIVGPLPTRVMEP